MQKKPVFIFSIVLVLTCCVTTENPSYGIWVTGISESVTRYYIPATTWLEETNRSVTCRLDMTYLNEPERPLVCNISFFIKNFSPQEITSLYFIGGSSEYPLDDVNIMFTRAELNELRITSTMDIDRVLTLFRSEKMTLKAVIDSAEYVFNPSTEFKHYSNEFLQRLSP